MNNAVVRTAWGRPLAVVAAGLFLISSVLPVVAGLSKNIASFPPVVGKLGVVLAILALAIMGPAQGGGKCLLMQH